MLFRSAIAPLQQDILKYAAPLPNDTIFTKEDCSADTFALKELEEEFQLEYPVVIGCLLWILNTYPRLQFAIRKLAKYMRLPGRVHFHAMKHLLHHIRCNHTFGLTYYSNVLDAPLSKMLHSHNLATKNHPFMFLPILRGKIVRTLVEAREDTIYFYKAILLTQQ